MNFNKSFLTNPVYTSTPTIATKVLCQEGEGTDLGIMRRTHIKRSALQKHIIPH